MQYLNRQVNFVASWKRNLWIGLLVVLYLDFIIIALEPFDTSQFEADYRFWLLSGYGLVTGMWYVLHGWAERYFYKRDRIWKLRDEMISVAVFLVCVGTVLCLYNVYVVNVGKSLTLGVYKHFMFITVPTMVPVFVPTMAYLRQRLGVKARQVRPSADQKIVLIGENRNERLELDRDALLFVKAVENYVEICFVDAQQPISRTFRQTLSKVATQLPFLEKCHRSYLVNPGAVETIVGNSQSARLKFKRGDKEIPVSKSYYTSVKQFASVPLAEVSSE